MSRIGRAPINLPAGVDIAIGEGSIQVKGKLGQLDHALPPGITVQREGKELSVVRSDDSRDQRALHGLTRALIANMVTGVSAGFSKSLEIVGVGYRCEQRGKAITLFVGYSHRVIFVPPDGVDIKVTGPTAFTVSGIDREAVGEVAAKIRSVRPPEPYKGKGIKYVGEAIRRKAGKTAGK